MRYFWAVERKWRDGSLSLMGVYSFSHFRDSRDCKDFEGRTYLFKTRERAREAIKEGCMKADKFCSYRPVRVKCVIEKV